MRYLLFIMVCFLSGCHQEMNYDYFMQHPGQLRKAIAVCEKNAATYCEDAYRAAEDFTALVKDRIDNPELFGKKIMLVQQEWVALSNASKQVHDSSQAQNLVEAYQSKERQIKIFYAVIVETSQGALARE